jgi:hypothetical protein
LSALRRRKRRSIQKQKIMDCEFLNPVDFQGNVPASSTDFWNFKNLICSSTTSTLPEYMTKITSTSTPERSFYILNTIDVGQILLLGFFVLALAFALIASTKNLIIKR